MVDLTRCSFAFTFLQFLLLSVGEASNSSNPYSPVPTATLAPGIGLDGRPVNTLITANLTTKDDAYNPFNPFHALPAFGKQVKNAFKCPFATCTQDVVTEDGDDAVDDSDYRIPAFLIMLIIFLAWHSGILISVSVSESPAMSSLTWGMPGPVFEHECRVISHLFLLCWRSMMSSKPLSTSFSPLFGAQAALIYITDCRMKQMCAAGSGHCPAQSYL
ncbi:CCNB1IP1 [Symbiodinium sp. CCMP2456]|nr:CCNB1IP1 [Symbiodinium sp. CCMP2456]